MHPPTAFTPQEFQPPTNIPPGSGPMHLESPNRFVPTQTILMAPTHQSPMRVGLPVPMMPPGAQLIQVQQHHPHGQSLQVVQRIGGNFSLGLSTHIFFSFYKQVKFFLIVRSFIRCRMDMSLLLANHILQSKFNIIQGI